MLKIDDDLYGTRALENKEKSFSNIKADKQGHSAETICDALIHITLGIRFCFRGDSQSVNLDKLVHRFVKGQGEMSLYGIVTSVVGRYGPLKLLKSLARNKRGSDHV